MARNQHARNCPLIAAVVLSIHVGLVSFSAAVHSPTWDEVGHLAAGLSHWQTGRFDLFRVNPPLVRLLGTLPLAASGVQADLKGYDERPGRRSEFTLGTRFFDNDPSAAFDALTTARWACLGFTILGALVCYRWASELYDSRAGLAALTMWCFCPSILAHAALITPDIGAASLGVMASYLYWKWLKSGTWHASLIAGLALGMAELAKMTLLLYFVIWPVLACLYRPVGGTLRRRLAQVSVILSLGILVLNLGYSFEGSLTRLKNYSFVSEALSGNEILDAGRLVTGNRFADSWLGTLPVPLPSNYLLGVDTQKRDFEKRMWSFLRGDWRKGGWFHYYLYAIAVKEPLGILGLVMAALLWSSTASFKDELVVLVPAIGILLFVSVQTGFNHHLRYVLPVYPLIFVLASRVFARPRGNASRRTALQSCLVASLLAWSITSSLFVYPHSLSYFNELAAGPLGGPQHLLASNTEWGQNLFYLRRWLDRHPETGRFTLAWEVGVVNPQLVGIDAPNPPPDEDQASETDEPVGPQPGWHILSVNELYDRRGRYAYFRGLRPAAVIGYSLYAYHLSIADVQTLQTAAEMHTAPPLHVKPDGQRSFPLE